ncbi:hypothetical protein KKA13_01555 [Patescibacteria group bacterium]|nr:hypothetical protein [Patescibacteria group bacterium]MBU1613427.1 hypothetical protein [Patescibacteria group bacterium]
MTLVKKAKDQLIKFLIGKTSVPRGLVELNQYFRLYGPISFRREHGENGTLIAISNNFRYGSIVTSGQDLKTLDSNIKDAILTSFEIPSSYAKEANIHKTSDKQEEYALA